MIFPERIIDILPTYKVLEIGPGSNPHPRSDVFLEKKFTSENEEFQQRGKAPKIELNKPLYYYENDSFPFKDNEFDYVICSQVIEHVKNVDVFVNEINRVASKGYIEYPTIYYEYLYNFEVHQSLIYFDNSTLYWMPKENSNLDCFTEIQKFFNETLDRKYFDFINQFKDYFFQGFEWEGKLRTYKASKLNDLCIQDLNITQYHNSNTNISYTSKTKLLRLYIRKFIKLLHIFKHLKQL